MELRLRQLQGCARRATPAFARARRSRSRSARDGSAWFLLNVSPEVRAQIEACAALRPRAPRHSPIAGLLLTNGDLDHCLGLLSLRESHPLVVYATGAVRAGFTKDNVLYRTLQRFAGQLSWRQLEPGRGAAADAERLGDGRSTPVAAPGKLPLHLEGVAHAVARGQRRRS